MFRVVVIDDEALVRVGLKSMVNWEEQDCELVGEASNGEAGFELINSLKPDIVITDIKMPVADGLQMIERLKTENIKAKFIVLSSYDEFNLVRQAMKLGVEDYLIKLEMEPDNLIKILTKLKEKIVSEFKKREKEDMLEKHIRTNKYAMREEFFKKVIGKIIKSEKEIDEELDYLQINLKDNNIVCATILINDIGKLKKYEEEDINLFEFSIINIVDEIVNDVFTGYTFKWTLNEYVTVFSCENEIEDSLLKVKVKDITERISTMLKQYFSIDVFIGVSNVQNSISNLSAAYVECSCALQQSFYVGTDKVIFFSDISSVKSESSNFDFAEITDDLLKYIELNDIEAIDLTFENIIYSLSKDKASKERAYDVCAKIAYLITIGVEKNEKSVQQIFGDNKTIFETILKLSSLKDVEVWLRKIKSGLCRFIASKETVQNNKLVSAAKRYVIENFGISINLQDVASMLNISAGYFSTIFKQVTGISFIDYVTEVKINEAKRLLKESNYKIYEIAQKTGYENAYYFSKVFKKVTGLTPREYIIKSN